MSFINQKEMITAIETSNANQLTLLQNKNNKISIAKFDIESPNKIEQKSTAFTNTFDNAYMYHNKAVLVDGKVLTLLKLDRDKYHIMRTRNLDSDGYKPTYVQNAVGSDGEFTYTYYLRKDGKDAIVTDPSDRKREREVTNKQFNGEEVPDPYFLDTNRKVDAVFDNNVYKVRDKIVFYANKKSQVSLNTQFKDATLWMVNHGKEAMGIMGITNDNKIKIYSGKLSTRSAIIDEYGSTEFTVNSLDKDENLTEISRIDDRNGLLKTDKGNVILFHHELMNFSHKIPEDDFLYIHDSALNAIQAKYGHFDKLEIMDKRLINDSYANNRFKYDLLQKGMVSSTRIKC